MNILNVNHLLDRKTGGGTAERTIQLSRSFRDAGRQCTVLTLDIGINAQLQGLLQSVRIVALRCLNVRYFVPALPLRHLHRLVATSTIVQLSGHWTLLNAATYALCRILGKPYVFCPAGALHADGRSARLKCVYDSLVGRSIARQAARCIAITEQERADFAAYGVAPDKVTVIPNGVVPAEFELAEADLAMRTCRQRYGLDDAPFILFLGRLSEVKGPDLLLEAFAAVATASAPWRLVFAGPDDGMLGGLSQRASELGLDARVHFIGPIGGTEKVALLRAAGLLAIPSRREAMSIVVLEAGICGTPVLFTSTCGLDEIAAAGAGVMVAPSTEGLAAGLAKLISPTANNTMAAGRLRHIIQESYTWERQAGKYLRLFDDISGNVSS